jgi:hypothetical protein
VKKDIICIRDMSCASICEMSLSSGVKCEWLRVTRMYLIGERPRPMECIIWGTDLPALVKRRGDRVEPAEFAAEAGAKGMARGTGGAGR